MAKLLLEIVTPEAKTFSEEVDMVVLPGVEGELGILPLHVPLMTRLLPGEVRILQGGKQTESGRRDRFCGGFADPRFNPHRHGDGRHGD